MQAITLFFAYVRHPIGVLQDMAESAGKALMLNIHAAILLPSNAYVAHLLLQIIVLCCMYIAHVMDVMHM